MITSADNPKVKVARALLQRRGREQAGQCLAEGVRLIEDVMRAGATPALIFFVAPAPDATRTMALLAAARTADVPVWELSPAVFGTLSDTVTSQGVIAVAPIPPAAPGGDADPILVLDQVRDPGNLGTILRSAEAAGVARLLLVRGCVDPWSPKVLRAGMGAHFRLSLQSGVSWAEVGRQLAGRLLWLADVRGDSAYDRVDWTARCALAVGGETMGFSAEATALAAGRVVIPMAGATESLNVAMAATVLLFEIARQRRLANVTG
ncbi:MAG: RNA methyltransferase [Chloroflexi bacterium HGW-Chloroflexi-1]|nr:MAG: RNA methyltransferase [Chloroflexi bacterium HGW-Chloroflexi-1]